MSKAVCLTGGSIYDGEKIHSGGALLFNREGITGIVGEEAIPSEAEKIHVEGRIIMPGMVDLHSDALEQTIEMRPGVYFDFEFALENLDRRAASCGITTFCHALSFADNELGLRSPAEVEKIVRMIKNFDRAGDAMVNHLVHARYEIGTMESLGVLERLLDEGLVDMVSVMDHTPNQGQFNTLSSFVAYYEGTYEDAREEILEMAERKIELQEEGWRRVTDLALRVKASGIPFLSHDDDTREKVGLLKKLGVGASEFPLSLAVALSAREKGLDVFMGAPNLVRDKSSGGHLKASETVAAGLCSGLLSDYYPECMLLAPFSAARKHGVDTAHALSLVTSGPGRFIRPGLGTLVPGTAADLIVVDRDGRLPRVSQTWVGGVRVLTSFSRSDREGDSGADFMKCA